jgi:hypothetical protein
MKKEFENKKQNLRIRKTAQDKNNISKICSSNNLQIFEKRNGRLSLCSPIEKKKIYNFSNFYQCKIILIIPIIFLPFLINDESIKRKSSFEFTKEASKNLIKRIKSEKKKKF